MSETPTPEPFTCDGCGQTDTDPMIHVGFINWKKDERTTIAEPSFHHDCLPDELAAELVGPQNAVAAAAVEAAHSGIRGEALREFIQAQPNDNDLEEN
ncbi:hypothetical protein EFK50_00985 [Nocardioides marmoriginsengisoli]|uniref:Uncharacterized protein n=1 Tax=Nocardioides marmoriginsengisoli TaxID=661483 RepID=A0A3N0CSI4_9ACTN|nr:hypothetical protein [Nocardioides marmoriginsengisoli]RNL66231.1 hypothetical protein EFK50_00985 [Nocardioides marmoriginsengisoli]